MAPGTSPGRRELFDEAPDALLTVDERGAVLACNGTARSWFGALCAEGRPLLSSLFLDSDADRVRALVARGWVGVSESALHLADGRAASLSVALAGTPEQPRYHLIVRDSTTSRVLAEAERERVRAEAVAGIAAAVSSELNDPVSVVLGRLELLVELGVDDPEQVKRHVEVALGHARRIGASMRSLRLVGRGVSAHLSTVFVAEVIDDALAHGGRRPAGLSIDVQPPELAAGGDAEILSRVLADVLDRAAATHQRSHVSLGARRDDEQVVVRVGAGATAASAAHVVDDGEPTDVAFDVMPLAESLVAHGGGSLSAISSRHGTGWELRLPAPPGRRARARRGAESLLVVGGHQLAENLDAILANDGFSVRHAATVDEALAVLDDANIAVAGVLSALLLEGISGLSLGHEALRRRPELAGKVAVISSARLHTASPDVPVLAPPLRRHQVLEALGRRVRRRR